MRGDCRLDRRKYESRFENEVVVESGKGCERAYIHVAFQGVDIERDRFGHR